jgi:hypothetical protein
MRGLAAVVWLPIPLSRTFGSTRHHDYVEGVLSWHVCADRDVASVAGIVYLRGPLPKISNV